MIEPQTARIWSTIVFVAMLAVAGEVLIAAGMKSAGDLEQIRKHAGIWAAIWAVLKNVSFLLGATCMAINFFAMLYALSIAELSLAAPAIASVTYIGNAFAAKLFLNERVDHRRWLATGCVAVGVVLLSR